MNGYSILDTITIDFELLIKLNENGKDHSQCNIDRNPADNVRQVFREHERTIVPPGQGLSFIRESKESNFTDGEHTEFPVCTEHGIGSAKSHREGLEGNC